MGARIDTRAIGLDVGLSFIRWLTGAENLHYGLWTGLEVTAGNLGAAQAAYTDRLFALMPGPTAPSAGPRPLRILDIGGGAGETARKLTALGHRVDIVVPSAFLAGRCRETAAAATVHETTFEDFESERRFDVCLFSESFQYIPLDIALGKAAALLAPGGEIVIADCFRTEAYRGRRADGPKPGGGHPLAAFRDAVQRLGLAIRHEEDITEAVAPSIDLEQALFNVFGHGLTRIDGELAARRPAARWMLMRAIAAFVPRRRREALWSRLTLRERTSEAFLTYNRYLMLRLCPAGGE